MSGFIIILALTAFFALLRLRASFFALTVLQMLLTLTGMAMLAHRGDTTDSTALLYAGSILLAIAGFTVARFMGVRLPKLPGAGIRIPKPSAVSAIVWFAGLLGTYHLIKSGIPILSANVERQRFDFTSSGFFGIPGRMYLFGTEFAWVLACVDACARKIKWSESKTWRIASAFYFGHALLSGFKGTLLSHMVLVIGVYVALVQPELRIYQLIRRYWWAALTGFGYFIFVATRYTTYQQTGSSLGSQLLDRATTVGALPGQLVLDRRLIAIPSNGLLNDWHVTLLKYSGQSIDGLYTVQRLVSAQILGESPASALWAPPVTVGGFPELTLSMTISAALLAMVIAGAICGFMETSRTRSPWVRTGQLIVYVAICRWMLKGDLVYDVINYTVVAIILAVVGMVGGMVSERTTDAPSKPVEDELEAAGKG
jgi:hypothetical protein